MSLAGKVVVITGASSGIGKATALKAVSEGAILALGDIDATGLDQALQACQSAITATATDSRRHIHAALDVTSTDACADFVQAVLAVHGRIDCVFNCAGINPTPIAMEAVTDALWDRLVNTNLKSVFNVTRACLPHMCRGSSFVNVSSVAGRYPVAQLAVYCAAKHAVIGFSRSLALEVGPHGIRVNVIAPGTVETPTNLAVRSGKDALESAAQAVGLRRTGTAEEIADVVVFLFSDKSSFMNGSIVDVDGGVGIPA